MKTKNMGIRRWRRAVPVTMLVGSAVICSSLATTAALNAADAREA